MTYQSILLIQKRKNKDAIYKFLEQKFNISYDRRFTLEITTDPVETNHQSNEKDTTPAPKVKTSIGIEEINLIHNWNATKSSSLQIAMILEGEKLTHQAQNSLLKVVEEPSNNKLICIVTNDEEKILETIKSRCQIYSVNQNTEEQSGLDEITNNVKEFLNYSFIERGKYLKKELILKDQIIDFLDGLMQLSIDNKISYVQTESDEQPTKNLVELIEQWYIIMQSNVNTKLIIESININLKNYKNG